MTHSMLKATFLEISAGRPEVVLCQTVQKHYAQGSRVYVLAGSKDWARTLDELLWTFEDESFVPHGVLDPCDPAEAVAIGTLPQNPNNAKVLVVNKDVPPELVAKACEGFSVVVDFVPKESPQATALARARYRALKNLGFHLTFEAPNP